MIEHGFEMDTNLGKINFKIKFFPESQTLGFMVYGNEGEFVSLGPGPGDFKISLIARIPADLSVYYSWEKPEGGITVAGNGPKLPWSPSVRGEDGFLVNVDEWWNWLEDVCLTTALYLFSNHPNLVQSILLDKRDALCEVNMDGLKLPLPPPVPQETKKVCTPGPFSDPETGGLELSVMSLSDLLQSFVGGHLPAQPNPQSGGIAVRTKVMEKIEEYVDEGRIFTAFDVTQGLRADDPRSVIQHNDIKRIVRGLYNAQDPVFDGMLCTAIRLGDDGEFEALCYHGTTQDANDHPAAWTPPVMDDEDDDDIYAGTVVDPNPAGYSAQAAPAASSTAPAAVATVITNQVLANAPNFTTFLTAESEGRLNIPSELRRDYLCLKVGDDVVANIENGKIEIIPYNANIHWNVQGSPRTKIYTVTVRGNIRIGKDLLDVLLPHDDTFRCDAEAGKITISRSH